MDYEINIDTLAVIPVSKTSSMVLEQNCEYHLNYPVMDVIDYSCKYFGSSYDGRNTGTYSLLGFQHKNPIIIEESNNIIFFPTKSPKNSECMWISYDNVATYNKTDDGKYTLILFKNGKEMLVPISYFSFSNQYLRSGMLKAIIQSRKIQKR